MADPELLPGRASPAGTRRFADRFPELEGHFRCPDRLWLSSLGFGTRGGRPGGADDLLYRGAALEAMSLGCNVFDTAISYRMMASERSLGAALGRAIRSDAIAREEVFVISKCGYLTVDPDSPLAQRGGRAYLMQTYVDNGLVDPHDVVNGVHCMSADFVLDQIGRSRRNLGLETIDLYCLDEPELQLAGHGPTAFRTLLAEAFAALERAVAAGWIGAYGLATWDGLLIPHTERNHLSVAELFELALEVGGPDHHLRGIALPYSVALGEARGLDSQYGAEFETAPVLDLLRDTGTAVFAAAPLVRGRAVRGLPETLRRDLPGLDSDAQRCLQFVRSTGGVTSALVGMRDPDHVRENLATARCAPLAPEQIDALYEQARRSA